MSGTWHSSQKPVTHAAMFGPQFLAKCDVWPTKCDVWPTLLRCLAHAWQPLSPSLFCFPAPFKDDIKDEQKTVLKLVLKRGTRRWRGFLFLCLTPYAFKTLRSDGEQLNGNQVLESLVAVTHCEFSYGVKHWRSCSATACLAESPAAYPHSLRSLRYSSADFLRELLTRNLTATTLDTVSGGGC